MGSLKTIKLHPILVFVACFAVYLPLCVFFQNLPNVSGIVQIRPVSALGPVLGLFFGIPAILGCATANFAADFMRVESFIPILIPYFLTQVIYNGLPRWIWYFIYRKSDAPYPRLDSSIKIALYMLLVTIDGFVVNFFNLYVLGTTSTNPVSVEFTLRTLNNIWMLLYVGLPLLYALERSALVPTPPPWIRVPYKRQKDANLTQRIAIAFTICVVIILLLDTLFVAISEVGTQNIRLAIRVIYNKTALLALPVFIPMFAFLYFLEKRLVHPIELLSSYQRNFVGELQEIAEDAYINHTNEDPYADPYADLSVTLPPEDFSEKKLIREVVDLVNSTNKMRSDLGDLNSKICEMVAHEQHAIAELEIAKQIQMSSVPTSFEKLEKRFDLDIAAVMYPCREVGGDFYDAFKVDDDRVGFIIGDVSGKGVPAALFMMRAQSTIRQNISNAPDLGVAITRSNNQLCSRNSACLFVTVFVCVLDTAKYELHFVNAGHNDPVLIPSGDTAEIAKAKHGLVLGAMKGVKYTVHTIDFSEGDSILLYTDGITEDTNEQDELYGDVRMLDSLNSNNSFASSMDIKIARLISSVKDFAGSSPQADDITAIGFSWNTSIKKASIDADVKHLDELNTFLADVCENAGASLKFISEIMLVAEEVFTNICSYGFEDAKVCKPIKVIAAIDEKNNALDLTFIDKGREFNPLQQKTSKADPDDKNRVGGLGILLVQKFTNDISYTYANDCNILRMVKRFV